jgi:NADPH-dependent 2,4-dienoyl-CoA reductase/sulfur reductase-like enzyme
VASWPTVADGKAGSGVVVVGASIAGLRAVETLRTDGYAGSVTLIGAEVHLPYDRPPLSKKLLAGDWEPDRIALRNPDEYGHLDLDLRLGVTATGLDVDGRAVHLADGSTVPYADGVIIATGTATKRLPGQEAVPTVHELRTIEDSLSLRERIADGTARVVVVGAGFIGLEVAATARARGCTVTVLEGLPAPLIRGLGPDMGAAASAVHAADGIDIRCGVTVTGLSEDGVTLGTGELVPADVIVVGIGVAPVTAWLDGSGLEVRDGVVCDATLAAAPGVWAVGDLCRWPNLLYDEEMRVEHWTNAAEQGAVAARNLLATAQGGAPMPYEPVPFFWSDQGKHRIQFLGRSATDDADEVVVAVGAPDQERWLALYRRGARLWGVLGANAPRFVMPYRKLLAEAVSWDDAVEFAATQQT